MLMSEVIRRNPLMEMGRPQKEVRRLIANYEDRLNEHLVKIILMPQHSAANGWRQECFAWCSRIARQRMGNDERTGTPSFYFDLLFDAPFGKSERVRLIGDLVKVVEDQFGLTEDIDLAEVALKLRDFHQRFSVACSQKATPAEIKDLIGSL